MGLALVRFDLLALTLEEEDSAESLGGFLLDVRALAAHICASLGQSHDVSQNIPILVRQLWHMIGFAMFHCAMVDKILSNRVPVYVPSPLAMFFKNTIEHTRKEIFLDALNTRVRR
jgi:hypothetical protein